MSAEKESPSNPKQDPALLVGVVGANAQVGEGTKPAARAGVQVKDADPSAMGERFSRAVANSTGEFNKVGKQKNHDG